MLRRSLRWLLPYAEARRLFLNADGQPLPLPTAPLPAVLEAIATNYRPAAAAAASPEATAAEREALIAAALQHVVQLDQTNSDSELLAAWTEREERRRRSDSTTSGSAKDEEDAATLQQVHTVVQLMKAFPNNIAIREMCCRCIANICQLSPATAAPSPKRRHSTSDARSQATSGGGADEDSSDASAESRANVALAQSLDTCLAEQLVRAGAVEQCLGTMAAAHRLTRKGRCWAAMALLNLACLSRSGASRAANACNGEEVLAEFLLFLLAEAAGEDVDGLTAMAVDAALGALTGVLAAEAPENSKGISYNYERVGYTAVDALVRSLLSTSALLVRDARNDGAYNASLPARRYGGTTNFLSASTRQQQAIATLLPPLHKGWMALRDVASHEANLSMVFDTMYEAANVNQESGGRVADEGEDEDEDDGPAGAGEAAGVLEVNAHTERRYVAALTNLLEAALFLVTELEGLQEVLPELAALQRDVSRNVMDVMATLTSPRKDIKEPRHLGDGSGDRSEGREDGEEEEPDVSAVLPTPAALGVTGVLASGLVSSMALATAVRLHSEQQERLDQAKHSARASAAQGTSAATAASRLTPYQSDHFTLLSKSLLTLHHLSETEDEVATSANTVAALQAMLRDAVDIAKDLPACYQGDVAALFMPADRDTAAGVIAAPHRLALMQHLALVGQIYAILYSVLRTPAGVALVTELDVPATATDMQDTLVRVYGRAISEARQRFGPQPSGEKRGAAEAAWVATAAEESVLRLTKLGEELTSTLAKLSAKPRA